MKKIILFLSLSLLISSVFAQTVESLLKENAALKAELNKPSKFSVSYKAELDSGLSLTNHSVELGYDFSGVRGLAGATYDWNFTKSSLYVGSEMVLKTEGKTKFLTFGQLGTTVGDTHKGWFAVGVQFNHSLNKNLCLVSQIKYQKATYFTAGANYDF